MKLDFHLASAVDELLLEIFGQVLVRRLQAHAKVRQLFDTDGEGGVGGSLDGLYVKDQGTKGPAGTGPGSPRRNPEEVGSLDYDRAHAELGDGSADFTSERAEQALATVQGEPEITQSLTS